MSYEESHAALKALMTGQVERCPLCKAPSSASGPVEHDAGWLECISCGLYFRKEMASEEDLAKFYEAEYRDPKYPSLHDRVVQLTRAERVLNYVKSLEIEKIERALDYGCANGVILEELRAEYGCKVAGVELNKVDQEIAKKRNITIYPTIEEVPGKFDLIVMTHVLEHLPDPVEFLVMLREKYATKGAHIAFEMPAPSAYGSWAIFHTTCWKPELFPSVLMRSGWKPMLPVQKGGNLFWAAGVNYG